MLSVNLLVVDRIQPQSNKLATICVWRIRLQATQNLMKVLSFVCVTMKSLKLYCFLVYSTKSSYVVFSCVALCSDFASYFEEKHKGKETFQDANKALRSYGFFGFTSVDQCFFSNEI